MEYDVFISHASEDKAEVALPLALHLQRLGLRVWLDEFELTLGDSLRQTIDRGLSQSRYGVVILSPAFFSKAWPNKELDGLVARESGRDKVILPIWHNVGVAEIIKYSPMLADKLAVSTSLGMEYIADQIYKAARRRTDGDEIPEGKREASEHDRGVGLRKLRLVGRWLAKLKKSVLVTVFILTGAIAVFVIVFYQPKGSLQPGYDFIQQASNARWFNGSKTLTFPGDRRDRDGFVYFGNEYSIPLESGVKVRSFLETHPEWVPHGTIEGVYGPFGIPKNLKISCRVGFLLEANGTDGVVFRIEFEENDGSNRILLYKQVAIYDGQMDEFIVDLNQVANKKGYIILSVDAQRSSAKDRAVWNVAKVIR